MFAFDPQSGQPCLADPEDGKAGRLLDRHVNGNDSMIALLFPTATLTLACLFSVAFLRNMALLTPLQTVVQGIITGLLIAVLFWVGFKMPDVFQDRQFEQAVTDGRILRLNNTGWKMIHDFLVANGLRDFVCRYITTPRDFAVIQDVSAAYYDGLVDDKYRDEVIVPLLVEVMARIKTEQRRQQSGEIAASVAPAT